MTWEVTVRRAQIKGLANDAMLDYMHHFYLLFKYAGAGAAIYISHIRKGYLPSIIVFGLGGTPHRMHS